MTVNCLHPGVVASNFGQGEGTGLLRLGVKLMKPFFINAEKGARTSVYLASSPEVEGVTGRYFDKCKAVASSERSQDEAVGKHLWAVSEKLTGLDAQPA